MWIPTRPLARPTTPPLAAAIMNCLPVWSAEKQAKARRLGAAIHAPRQVSTKHAQQQQQQQQPPPEPTHAATALAQEQHPQLQQQHQQPPPKPTHAATALAWAGRVGWCGKGVVYSVIGGLAAQAAVGSHRPDPSLPQTAQVSISPQGAFVLLGTTPGRGGVHVVLLLVMMAALAAYVTWRFWEGLAGQGYDAEFSAAKNFFKFRVSPIVSGAVYVSYLVFLITLLDQQVRHVSPERGPPREGWPAPWRHSTGGRVGLAFLGIAFLIATAIQLQGVLSSVWHADYRESLPRRARIAVFGLGHVGFAGRAGAFLALSVLFFRDAGGGDNVEHSGSMVSMALVQLQGSQGLRALLFIIGFLLIVYGLFAVLSSWVRHFPTLPPSRRKQPRAAAGAPAGGEGAPAGDASSSRRGSSDQDRLKHAPQTAAQHAAADVVTITMC